MDKLSHSTLYNGCNHLSMLELKLIHASKRGHRSASVDEGNLVQNMIYSGELNIIPVDTKLFLVECFFSGYTQTNISVLRQIYQYMYSYIDIRDN